MQSLIFLSTVKLLEEIYLFQRQDFYSNGLNKKKWIIRLKRINPQGPKL